MIILIESSLSGINRSNRFNMYLSVKPNLNIVLNIAVEIKKNSDGKQQLTLSLEDIG